MFKRLMIVALSATVAIIALLALRVASNTTIAEAGIQNVSQRPIVIGTTDDIISLDPAQTYNSRDWEILYNVGSGLLTYIPGTSILSPGLAITMPEVSSDGLIYTFTLRSGLKFSDGTDFNASAVKSSLDRVKGKAGDPSFLVTDFITKTTAVNSTTLRIVLKQSVAFFPQLTAHPIYYPIPINDTCYPTYEFNPTSTCGGIGPYSIVSWTQGVSIELSANPNYYGEPPQTPSIIVQFFDTTTDLRQALEAGDIDVAWSTLTLQDYQELSNYPDLNVVDVNQNFIRFLCFNTTTSPFDNASIRTALAAAIDRESVATDVYSDSMSALYSMIPDGIWSHDDSFFDLYGQRNLSQAQTLLRQEGYSETNKLEMELWYPLDHYGSSEPQFASELAADIAETGMVSVTVQSADWATYVDNFENGMLPVFLLGWWPDYPDPDNYTWPFAYSSKSDDTGIFYNDSQMDDMLETARATMPVQGNERLEKYHDIQAYWALEAPTIPLLQGKSSVVTQDEIHGVMISPYGLPFFTLWRYKVYLPLVVAY